MEVLTDSPRPRKYWSDLKSKLKEEGFEVSDFIGLLKLEASDGKLRLTDCANTKSMFRIYNFIKEIKETIKKDKKLHIFYFR